MAIRIPCDALHRPLPEGAERKRIATSGFALLAMTTLYYFQIELFKFNLKDTA